MGTSCAVGAVGATGVWAVGNVTSGRVSRSSSVGRKAVGDAADDVSSLDGLSTRHDPYLRSVGSRPGSRILRDASRPTSVAQLGDPDVARHHIAASDRSRRAGAARGKLGSAVLALLLGLTAAGCANTASPSPSATSASGSPLTASIAPSPAPTRPPQTAAIEKFVALVTTKGFSYQATFSGDDRHSASILQISKGLLQVHGADVRVQATFTDPTASTVVEHRYVGGKGWLRFATFLPWARLPITPAQTMAAFAAIKSARDVTYVETVKSGGKTLFRVTFRAAIVSPAIIPYINLSDENVRKATMTILIDANGRPIRGTDDINATGRISGQLQEIVIELTVAFTKVGQKVSISAP
jgi:hypothetical protein